MAVRASHHSQALLSMPNVLVTTLWQFALQPAESRVLFVVTASCCCVNVGTQEPGTCAHGIGRKLTGKCKTSATCLLFM